MANKINHDIANFFVNILNDAQVLQIKDLLKDYKSFDDAEFEVSFRNINYSNYMRILQHYINITNTNDISTNSSLDVAIPIQTGKSQGDTLRASFYESTNINDFITKFSKSNIKEIANYIYNLHNIDNVQIMIKQRANANKFHVADIDAVFKTSQEIQITDSNRPVLTGNEHITYRYKQRASFKLNDNCRLDITEVKQSNNLMDITSKYSKYEVEIEFTNKKINIDTVYNQVYSTLIVVQDSEIPISKTESDMVLQEYRSLLNVKPSTHLDSRNVISIEINHLINFIPNKYAITDKADGERFFLFSLPNGVYLLSLNLTVKRINLKIEHKKYHYMIIDGELIKGDKNMYFAFDIVYAMDIDYRHNMNAFLPQRLYILNDIIKNCFNNYVEFTDYTIKNKNIELNSINKYYSAQLVEYWKQLTNSIKKSASNLFVTRKLYFIPYGIHESEVFMYANLIWKLYVYNHLTPYKLDGIIYTPISTPYMIRASYNDFDRIPLEYKWKKPSQNSIDFYIKFEKDANGKDAVYYDSSVTHGTGNSYKICVLHVSVNNGGQDKAVIFKVDGIEQRANIYLIDDEARDLQGNIIEDNTVVEFIYDNADSELDNAYKWIPLKIRYDKTETVQKYNKRFGNNLNIAIRIWRSITNPITEENIASLANSVTYAREIERLSASIKRITPSRGFVYYQKSTNEASGMRAFNNLIKSNMIYTYCDHKPSVLDIGCGRGGDIGKFVNANIQKYVGVDIDNNGLFVINDSAYKRYQSLKKKSKYVPSMHFINADARGLFDVKSQEKIIANMSDINKKNISTYLSGAMKYSVINCQFTLHYYLSDEISWNNFCENINNHLDDNGYMLITCFDGALINEKLKNKSKLSISYTNNSGSKVKFFEITKIYSENDSNANIGLAVDIYNSLISNEGVHIREYLVFPEFLKKSLHEKCGLQLVESDSFFNLFNMYRNYFIGNSKLDTEITNISKHKYNDIRDFYMMLDSVNANMYSSEDIDANLASFKLSMLNKYYVFKKSTKINVTQPARVIGMNNKFLAPYLTSNNLYIDTSNKNKNINEIYHKLRLNNKSIKPNVYLIKNIVPRENIDNALYLHNKFYFANVKKGDTGKIFIIYKCPQKLYYPIYYKNNNNIKYILDSENIINDLDLLVAISNNNYL